MSSKMLQAMNQFIEPGESLSSQLHDAIARSKDFEAKFHTYWDQNRQAMEKVRYVMEVYKEAMQDQGRCLDQLVKDSARSSTYHSISVQYRILSTERDNLFEMVRSGFKHHEMLTFYQTRCNTLAERIGQLEAIALAQTLHNTSTDKIQIGMLANEVQQLTRQVLALRSANIRLSSMLAEANMANPLAYFSCTDIDNQCKCIEALLTKVAASRFGDDLHTRASARACQAAREAEMCCESTAVTVETVAQAARAQGAVLESCRRDLQEARSKLASMSDRLGETKAQNALLRSELDKVKDKKRELKQEVWDLAHFMNTLVSTCSTVLPEMRTELDAALRGMDQERTGWIKIMETASHSEQQHRAELEKARAVMTAQAKARARDADLVKAKAHDTEVARVQMELAIRKLECQTSANKVLKKRADELSETTKQLKTELVVVTQTRDQMTKRVSTLDRDIAKLRAEKAEKIKEKSTQLEACQAEVAFLSCENATVRHANAALAKQLQEARYKLVEQEGNMEKSKILLTDVRETLTTTSINMLHTRHKAKDAAAKVVKEIIALNREVEEMKCFFLAADVPFHFVECVDIHDDPEEKLKLELTILQASNKTLQQSLLDAEKELNASIDEQQATEKRIKVALGRERVATKAMRTLQDENKALQEAIKRRDQGEWAAATATWGENSMQTALEECMRRVKDEAHYITLREHVMMNAGFQFARVFFEAITKANPEFLHLKDWLSQSPDNVFVFKREMSIASNADPRIDARALRIRDAVISKWCDTDVQLETANKFLDPSIVRSMLIASVESISFQLTQHLFMDIQELHPEVDLNAMLKNLRQQARGGFPSDRVVAALWQPRTVHSPTRAVLEMFLAGKFSNDNTSPAALARDQIEQNRMEEK